MYKKHMLGVLAVLLTIGGFVYYSHVQSGSAVLTIGEGCIPNIAVSTEQSVNTVRLWVDEATGDSWFFLPSCVRQQKLILGDTGAGSLRINGELLEEGDVCVWEEGRSYEIQITDEAYQVHSYTVSFMRSENIPAVFINTASGGMAYLEEDKENEEPGDICVVHEDGNTEYQGTLERISGRGNSTWEYEKKPYSIKLTEKYPLCGLDKGDKWRLLALWREGSKLDNKLAMDLAEELGLAYSAQGTWVDLYLNGEYAGNYLLAESVSVGEGRVDITNLERENKRYNEDVDHAERYEEQDSKGYLIEAGDNVSGGYLIEKDHPDHYAAEAGGFATSRGNLFTINAPQHVSREQVQYIRDYVENIEQLAQNGQSAVWDYLDVDSFAGHFLVDELSLNTDAGLTSMYFYKERDDDKLYSGPVWDYDNSFGESNTDGEPGYDYAYTILDLCGGQPNRLDWYAKLYDTPELQRSLRLEYEKTLPFFEEMLERGLDEYAETIRASVMMDEARWESRYLADGFMGVNVGYDANIKYMKAFVAKRLNWLCDRWGVAHEAFQTPSDGQTHTVTFANYDGVVGTMQVPDGAELGDAPAYDESVYQGWENRNTGDKYRRQIPVYEDMVFYNAKWE